ncbi:MerR family transcriptional regulator [Streptomyces sp. NPDC026672]|uniref:MerR family transcriptional regulator n=1 Tax=unclassified Streptomyces TaxID=2593676 RepID=UPI0033C6D981
MARVDDTEPYPIGRVAHRTGPSVGAIRFYSDAGIIAAGGRSDAGYRLYDVHAVARLELVRSLRELGAGLDEIREALTDNRTTRGLRTGPGHRRPTHRPDRGVRPPCRGHRTGRPDHHRRRPRPGEPTHRTNLLPVHRSAGQVPHAGRNDRRNTTARRPTLTPSPRRRPSLRAAPSTSASTPGKSANRRAAQGALPGT